MRAFVHLLYALAGIIRLIAVSRKNKERRAITRANTNTELAHQYYIRGAAKLDQRDFDGAIADFGSAIALNPNNAGYYYARGDAKHKKGDIHGAIDDFGAAIVLDPYDADYYFFRGVAKDDLESGPETPGWEER